MSKRFILSLVSLFFLGLLLIQSCGDNSPKTNRKDTSYQGSATDVYIQKIGNKNDHNECLKRENIEDRGDPLSRRYEIRNGVRNGDRVFDLNQNNFTEYEIVAKDYIRKALDLKVYATRSPSNPGEIVSRTEENNCCTYDEKGNKTCGIY